jgi:DNA-binding PadR family transcriptional regulator
MKSEHILAYLPLTETTFFIVLSLAISEKHGYAIAKDVEGLSDRRVVLSTSTLYTALKRLLADGLIERSGEDPEPDESGRPRKTYTLTTLGCRILDAETVRLRSLVHAAKVHSVGEEA